MPSKERKKRTIHVRDPFSIVPTTFLHEAEFRIESGKVIVIVHLDDVMIDCAARALWKHICRKQEWLDQTKAAMRGE